MRALLALLAAPGLLLAADATAPASDAPAAKPYPLKTCLISGEELGGMGDPYVVVREGQEIKLCCKGCLKKLDKDVPGALAKLKAQAEKTQAEKAPPAPAGGH